VTGFSLLGEMREVENRGGKKKGGEEEMLIKRNSGAQGNLNK